MLPTSSIVTSISIVPALPLIIEALMRSWSGWQLVLVTAVVVVDDDVVVVELVLLVVLLELDLEDLVVVVVERRAAAEFGEGVLEQAASTTETIANAGSHTRRRAVTNRSLRA
ncbi:MAG: hypothetical protein ACYCU7_10515 [Acidimicrobiales bacterium]